MRFRISLPRSLAVCLSTLQLYIQVSISHTYTRRSLSPVSTRKHTRTHSINSNREVKPSASDCERRSSQMKKKI
ncbi:hypothetical protein BU24DRAFT_428391, partial [Aaosphaeria arxii CBS 175.79]